MALDQASILRLIRAEVGDIDPITLRPTGADTGLVASHIADIWAQYADKDAVAPRLRALWTKWECYTLLINQLRRKIDVTEDGAGVRVSLSQEVKALQQQQDHIWTTLQHLEQTAGRTSGKPVAGVITAARPTYPPRGQPYPALDPRSYPDPGDPRYVGSPYERTWGGDR